MMQLSLKAYCCIHAGFIQLFEQVYAMLSVYPKLLSVNYFEF